VFTRGAEVKKVYFKDGDVVFAASNLDEDRLGEFLLRTGKITREQFDASSETVIRTKRKLGAVLFEMGALTAHDLVAQVKLQVKHIILSLFSRPFGRLQFTKGPLPVSEIIPLNMSTGDLILEGVRGFEGTDLPKALPPDNTVLRTATNPSHLFQSAHLDRAQQEVFALVNGRASIRDLCSRSGLGDDEALKAIYALLALRMVDTAGVKADDVKVAEEAQAREVMQEEQQFPPDAVATREMVLQASEGLGKRNHYEVLGIGKGAALREIRKAYLHAAKLYHPDRHFDPGMSDLREKLETLFDRVHEAYETLSSQDARKQYDRDLASGATTAGQRERAQKPDEKDTARVQFNEGLKRFQEGNFWGAEEAFSWAVRLDPGNADYLFHQARSLSRMPRRAHDAEELYLAAIALAPSRTEFCLELGNFYAKSGLKAKARSSYMNALERDPNSEAAKTALNALG
jgi:curved DNA-binding protein CbpA